MNQQQPQSPPPTVKESFLAKLLDPLDRLTEGIYSVLIVLTFTLAFRVLQANSVLDQETASTLLSQLFVAALGCAVAWGIIDGIMYVLTSMAERSQQHRLIRAIRHAASEQEGVAMVAAELDDKLKRLASDDEREALYRDLYRKLKAMIPQPVGFKKGDFAGALGVAIVAVTAALPVVLPLLLFQSNPPLAIRASNLVAFGMLFGMGYSWGKYIGAAPWKLGLALPMIGVVMMAVAIPLGG